MKRQITQFFSILLLLIGTSFTELFSQSNQWTWVKGEVSLPTGPVYGTKGIGNILNTPGARSNPVTWTDKQGRFWLFGGEGANSTSYGTLGDLWRFDRQTNEWTWIKGTNTLGQSGIYGTKGVSAPENMPGARYAAVSWTDSLGRLWLFGGIGYSSNEIGDLNDLWCFDPFINEWTWINGSNLANQGGVYGTKGIAAPGNVPWARRSSVGWTGKNGKLWLYGGVGYIYVPVPPSVSSGTSWLNDLWSYDLESNEWTWVQGSIRPNLDPVYGTKGIADSLNTPGAREESVGWTDTTGKLWLFGGGYVYAQNDLWRYDPQTNQWTWVSGTSQKNQQGNYGIKGVPSTNNYPGGRNSAVAWTDKQGRFGLFGGRFGGTFNDLWIYNTQTNEWTWISGSNLPDQTGNKGIMGIESPANVPKARHSTVGWTDDQDNIWLFGGQSSPLYYTSTLLNDLWRFNTQNGEWTWVKGSDNGISSAVYGTQGLASPENTPGYRVYPASWTDKQGRFWLFGGQSSAGYINDLWRFDQQNNTWTWLKGSQSRDQRGIYGTLGVPAPGNTPGSRRLPVTWTDSLGQLWLFGGAGYFCGFGDCYENFYNDLWRYNPQSNVWTWMKGSNNTGSQPVYGTKGVPAPGNTPGASVGSVGWKDSQGRFWLYDNNLWRYDPGTGQWTWINGSANVNQLPVYGKKGVSVPGNTPGNVKYAVSWIDKQGQLWLFGGKTSTGMSNDLWRFNPQTLEWTWEEGNTVANQPGVYGTQGKSAPGNTPGERYSSIGWQDDKDRLWLFGGYQDGKGYLNDLWNYNLVTKQWTWVKGSSNTNALSIVNSIQGISDQLNTPGARLGSGTWTDTLNRLWMFSGAGYRVNGFGYFDDIFRFHPSSPSPGIYISSPANNSLLPIGSDITVTVNTADPGGTISYMDFYTGNYKLGTDSSAPYSLSGQQVNAGSYPVSASTINNAGDTLYSDTVFITVSSCQSQGSISGLGYINIPGTTVAQLTSDPGYPGSPSISAFLNIFEYQNVGDNYGGRLRGYFCAPQTGNYIFNIAGDDQAGLFLSTDDKPTNKVLIAYTETGTGFRQWNKFSTQQSAPIPLVAGNRYYVETLHKEGVSGDHLSVAWKLPNGTFEGPIPGSRLSPYQEDVIVSSSAGTGNFETLMRLSADGLTATATPNPSRSMFNINIQSNDQLPVSIKVTDILGRVIESRSKVQVGNLQLGQNWKSGMYFIELSQGTQRRVLKLVKE